MKIELELWHLVLLFSMFCGVVFGFGKILLSQFEKRMQERFERFEKTEQAVQDLLKTLPEKYQRREDWIRESTVINAKLDALFGEIKALTFQLIAKQKGNM